MHIIDYWNRIKNNGVQKELSFFDSKRIRIINVFSFFSTLFALLFTIILFLSISVKLAIYDIIAAVCMALPFYLNYKKKYKIAAIISFVLIPIIILLMVFIYGEVGNEYYYFPAIILIFFYYKRRKYLLSFSIYYIILFLLIKYIEPTITPSLEITTFTTKYYLVSIGFALTMTIAFLLLFTIEYENNQAVIEEKNSLLKQTVKETNEKNKMISSLLKELNHRVKNNLQLVSSILNLQLSSLEDPIARKAIEESKNRIISMALLHRMLYREGDEMKINMREYIHELADYLKTSILSLNENDSFELNIQNFFLPLETSVSIGLILNELITNSFKHGFTNLNSRKLTVSASLEKVNKLYLEVADNGTGFDSDFSIENNSNFGLDLVDSLVHQYKGEITIDNNGMNKVIMQLFV